MFLKHGYQGWYDISFVSIISCRHSTVLMKQLILSILYLKPLDQYLQGLSIILILLHIWTTFSETFSRIFLFMFVVIAGWQLTTMWKIVVCRLDGMECMVQCLGPQVMAACSLVILFMWISQLLLPTQLGALLLWGWKTFIMPLCFYAIAVHKQHTQEHTSLLIQCLRYCYHAYYN